LGGVLAMFGSIVVLFLIPFINQSEIRSSIFRPIYKKIFWFLFIDFVILG
jgi:ubiquinol-cytochrome c reductase cytochrome b subunit